MNKKDVKFLIKNVIPWLLLLSKTQRFRRELSGIEVLDFNGTMESVIEGKTFSRYGDGEFKLMESQEELGFQKFDSQLSQSLIRNLNNIDNDILIGIPHHLVRHDSTDKLTTKIFWDIALARYGDLWLPIIKNSPRLTFGDANVTRKYMESNKKMFAAGNFFQQWKRLWDSRNVLLVEGENTNFGESNDLLDNTKSIRRVLVPSENAFSAYDEIMAEIKRDLQSNGRDVLILVAAGPTATVLAPNIYTDFGVQAIDIGHLDLEYEWFLQGLDFKTKVEGKYVNER
ncbi:GT-D fold domain-containing glycosyltransferase [Weissella confusa]